MAPNTEYREPSIYPAAIGLIIFSGFAILLDIPPMIWHTKNKNFAACSMIAWIIYANFTDFLDALIWPNDRLLLWWTGEGLCDVQAKLEIGSWVGLPGAIAGIVRSLARVMDTEKRTVIKSSAEKKRDFVFTLVLAWIFPLCVMALHYLVQPNRFLVVGISGCEASFDGSWLGVVLIFIWPSIFSIVDAYYAVLLIIRLRRHRSQFSSLLQNANTTQSRFLRLFVMSLVLVIAILPLQGYILFRNVELGVSPYSWSRTHGPEWNQAVPVPSNGHVPFDSWIHVAIGFLVFIFFGMGNDATRMYKNWLIKFGFGKIFPNLTSTTNKSSPPSSSFGSFKKVSTKLKEFISERGSGKSLLSSLTSSYTETQIASAITKQYVSAGIQTDLPYPLTGYKIRDSFINAVLDEPRKSAEDISSDHV